MVGLLVWVTLLISVVMVVVADTWMLVWLGFELNLVSFIGFMCGMKSSATGESALKYFLAQALGSAIFLLAVMLGSSLVMVAGSGLLMVAMMLKLGCAPLHQWLPSIAEGLEWKSLGVLLTWQSVAPMVVLMHNWKFHLGQLFIWGSALVGGLGGLGQVLLRRMLTYSSITHMAWMLLLLSEQLYFWCYYLGYVMILGALVGYFDELSVYSVNSMGGGSDLFFVTGLLSLGGLPPLLGFFPKLVALWALVAQHSLVLFMAILGSLLNLGYYLRLIFKDMTLSAYVGGSGVVKSQVGWLNLMSVFLILPAVLNLL